MRNLTSALIKLSDSDLSFNNAELFFSCFKQAFNFSWRDIDIFTKLFPGPAPDVQLERTVFTLGGYCEKLSIQLEDFERMIDSVHYFEVDIRLA